MVMYQKSEKGISVIVSVKTKIELIKSNIIYTIFIVMLSFGSLWAQIDNRFNVYSWEQYGEVGMVNSISEDYSYFYFATDNAGIIRINKFYIVLIIY